MKKTLRIMQNKIILFLLFFVVETSGMAQYYQSGCDPASVHWLQIKTKNYRLIFPSDFINQAKHTAYLLDSTGKQICSGLHAKPLKTSIILHNQSVISNAEVVWAPRRIEFYTCPGQDIYPQPWLDQLVLHEYRHQAQLSKINTKLTKVLSWFFGEQITGGIFGAYVPGWFAEGDAVYSETIFSNSGRGRIPTFEAPLRAQLVDKGYYSFNKASLNSYRTFIPDKYIFGYYFTTWTRKNFSDSVWNKSLERVSGRPYMIVPFNHGIKKSTGLNKRKLYNLCFNDLRNTWKSQDSLLFLSSRKTIPIKKQKSYCDYIHPKFINDSTIVAVKSGLDNITRFVKITMSGKEKRLREPGNVDKVAVGYGDETLIWSAFRNDVRWEQKSFSIIKYFSLQDKHIHVLKRNTRFFAPSISPDGSKIVCVNQSSDGKSSLVIINSKNKNIESTLQGNEDEFFMTPSWSENGKEIVFISLDNQGKKLMMNDTEGNKKMLFNAGFNEIKLPSKFGNRVYFIGSYTGIDNIYYFDLETQEINCITSSRFGVHSFSLNKAGDKIVYAEYTSDGYRLSYENLDNLKSIETEKITCKNIFGDYLSTFKPLDIPAKGQANYEVKKYSKCKNLFNFHSWGPLSIDADNTTVKPGFQLLSQNVLSSMIVSLGYEHDWNSSSQLFYSKISYKGWYPQIDLAFGYYFFSFRVPEISTIRVQPTISLPLRFGSGKYYSGVLPSVSYNFSQAPFIDNENKLKRGNFHFMSYGALAYRIKRSTEKDIKPRWGQVINLSYNHMIFQKGDYGNSIYIAGMLYFPGIGKHHSLNLYLGYEKLQGNYSMLGNQLYMPKESWSNDLNNAFSLRGAYEFPLFYPDWSLGSLIYFKRFRAGLHYEYASIKSYDSFRHDFHFAGVSILSDLHVLRFVAPVSLGCKALYNFQTQKISSVEFLYSINFDALNFRNKASRVFY